MAKQLLTRREIIEIWKTQDDKILDSYSCPFCRDILQIKNEKYYCSNEMCKCEDEDIN